MAEDAGRSGPPETPPDSLPDRTVDFAAEILNTPPQDLARRVRKLSADMRATVLVEVARRFQSLARRVEESDRELANLRFHAERLEKMLLEVARRRDV